MIPPLLLYYSFGTAACLACFQRKTGREKYKIRKERNCAVTSKKYQENEVFVKTVAKWKASVEEEGDKRGGI